MRLQIKSGKGRKAQLSAFILLGLVILVIFFFLLYIKGQIVKARVEGKIDVVAEILQKTPALNYYVTLCLKDSIESALILVGKQGGDIYVEQGGLIDRNSVPIFKYKDDNITYGLTSADTGIANAQKLLGEPSYPLPPGYPCILSTPPISYKCNYDSLFPIRFYPFSQSHLPLLCINGGPNDVEVGIYPFPCPSDSYGPDSMQQQMKIYAEKRMVNCTNFSAIRQLVDFNITAGTPEIMPIMGENDVVVKATYPINITVGSYSAVRLFNFEVNIPVRLKKIYGLARFLADNDRSYLDFNITKDFNSDSYYNLFWDPYMRVEKFCPKCSLEGDEKDTTDILQINDSASNMMGSDYYFRFAIENRIPALDWIRKTAPGESYDYILQEGDEIIIEPQGIDPDDNDDMYYQYEGWKQTYDEVFDPSCCNELNPDSPVICKQDPWKCVKKAPAASLQLCMDNYIEEDKNVWTTSELYLPDPDDPSDTDTYRRADYLTKTTDPAKISANPDSEDMNPIYYPCLKDEQTGEWLGNAYSRDLGPHNVTVLVCDKHDKCDLQDVLIMVTDIPKPVIEIINDYGTKDASLEDPFTLDASKSNIFAAVEKYTWKDFISGVGIPEFDFTVPYGETQNGKIKIPFPFQGIDITAIKGANNFFKQTGLQTLSLTIGSQTDTKDITVKECIPYAGSYASYPYNPEGTDPFQGSHACCEADGTYSTTAKECYSAGEYGSMKSFDPDKYLVGGLTTYVLYWHLDSNPPTQTPPSLTGQYGNDIFFRSFGRFCSGDRGNMCSGNAQEDRYISTKCSDLEYPWQDERCQGPIQGVFGTASDAYCMNYNPGETFESVEGIGTPTGSANGFCSDIPRCTNGLDYSINGPFQCQKALCQNGRCTKPNVNENVKCMCNPVCGSSSQCSAYSYDDLKSGGLCLQDGSGYCSSSCQFIDPDMSITACSGCGKVWNVGGGTEINVDSAKCCGNDPAEYYVQNIYDNSDGCCDNKNAAGTPLSGDECVISGTCQDRIASTDICNGIDDDCNPLTADGSGENAPLNSNQIGVCLGSRKSCYGATGWQDSYSAAIGYQTIETLCNDGKDNDCNGVTDC